MTILKRGFVAGFVACVLVFMILTRTTVNSFTAPGHINLNTDGHCAGGFLKSRQAFWPINKDGFPFLADAIVSNSTLYVVFNTKILPGPLRLKWPMANWTFNFASGDTITAQSFGSDPHGHTFIIYSIISNNMLQQNVSIAVTSPMGSHKYENIPFCPHFETQKRGIISCTQCLVDERYMPLLPEWVAYHILQGIEHIYIYANGPAGRMQAFLKPFISVGVVTVVDWHWPKKYQGDFAFQQSQENSCLLRARFFAQYVALHDVDEFFHPYHGNISKLVLQKSSLPWAALQVRSWWFGGHIDSVQQQHFNKLSDNLTIAQWVSRAPNPVINGREKCIVRPQNVDYFSVHMVTKGGRMHVVDVLHEMRLIHIREPPSMNFSLVDFSLQKLAPKVKTMLRGLGYR